MKSYLKTIATLLLMVFVPSAAPAWDGQSLGRAAVDHVLGNPLTDMLDFSPLERQLFLDCAGGGLHELSMVDAALMASGVDDAAAMDTYRQQFLAILDEAARLTANIESPLARVELIHRVLHQRLLQGGYDSNATNLAATLRTGVYNCASATLLFVALAAELNVQAQAIELPGHVRAVIDCGERRYEVEVTCPVWQEAVRAWTGNVGEKANGVNGENSAGSREVSPCGLVAMIYYNRGIDAFNEGRYGEAVATNRKALLLDGGNPLARANLLAAINNWALALCDTRRFAEAEMLLAEGRQYDPQHAAFIHNAIHVQQVWLQIQAGSTAAQKAGPAMPSP